LNKPKRPDFEYYTSIAKHERSSTELACELIDLIYEAKEYIEYLEAKSEINPSDFCHEVCDIGYKEWCKDPSHVGLCLKNAKSAFAWIRENGYRIVKEEK